MTREQVAALLLLIAGAYPNRETTEETLQAYIYLLSDLDPADARHAVEEHCKTSKWPPTIAEIRDAALRQTRSRIEHDRHERERIDRALDAPRVMPDELAALRARLNRTTRLPVDDSPELQQQRIDASRRALAEINGQDTPNT